MKQIRVILLGHNYNSLLGFARALGIAGYEVFVIRTGIKNSKFLLKNIGKKPESKSKYVKYYRTINENDEDSLINILINEISIKDQKSVLFPVDDVCAEIIDLNLDSLKEYYFLPNSNYEQGRIVKLMDKFYQKQLAEKAGLLVLKGWSVKIENGKFDMPEDVSYPCFVKAELPFAGRKKFMKKCDDRHELFEALKNVAKFRDCMMIVEEFAEFEKEYCIVGLCNYNKVYIPDVIDEKIMGHGPHAGVTCFGEVVSPDIMPEFIEKLKTMLQSINFQGLFTVDVIKNKEDYIFCELNLRIGGSGPAIIGAGVNIAVLYVQSLMGIDTADDNLMCRNITFASERPLLSDYALGHISWKEYKKYIKDADYRFIYSEDDTGPYNNYIVFVLREKIRRILLKIQKK